MKKECQQKTVTSAFTNLHTVQTNMQEYTGWARVDYVKEIYISGFNFLI